MAAPSSPARPRVWRLQFSLRLALVAFTAFAIGFPIWYRWPYEEEVVRAAPGFLPTKTIITWRRQWGGGKLKDGPEKVLIGGAVSKITTYRNGRKHGPFTAYVVTSKAGVRTSDMANPATRGQYVDDWEEGVWTHTREISGPDGGKFEWFRTWHHGVLNGPAEIALWPLGSKVRMVFAAGRLKEVNGKPARNRLFDLFETEAPSRDALEQMIGQELHSLTEMQFIETALKDVIAFLRDRHSIPFELDPRVPDVNLPITKEERGMDLCSALTLLTAPHELGCDYRYGCIWITTAADAEDWHDPTGVSELKPPNGSGLARIWEEPAESYMIGKPLSDELKALAAQMVIEIDTAAIESTDITVTFEAKAPFRHVLGQLLYRTGCRCKLEGDKLIILPPEMAAP
jgi:hypothetical protein